jgi:hypothetical protein
VQGRNRQKETAHRLPTIRPGTPLRLEMSSHFTHRMPSVLFVQLGARDSRSNNGQGDILASEHISSALPQGNAPIHVGHEPRPIWLMNSAFHSSRCKLIANNVRGHHDRERIATASTLLPKRVVYSDFATTPIARSAMTRRFSAGGRLPERTTSSTRRIVSLFGEPAGRPAPARLPPVLLRMRV